MASSKLTALKVINPLIGVLFIVQVGTGVFNDVIPYELFSNAHGLAGYLLSAGVVVHFILNWSWFATAFKKRK